MSKMDQGFNIPEDMRQMVDQGVSQAREGFTKLMEVAQEATADFETKADKTQSHLLDTQKKAMAFTQANVTAAFEMASKMVQAKTLDEVTHLQSQYITAQFETLMAHAGEAASFVQDHAKSTAAELAAEAEKFQAKARAVLEKGMEAARSAAEKNKK